MALVNLKPTAKGVTTLIIAAAVGVGVCVLACYGAMRKVDNLSRNLAKMEKQAAGSQQIAQRLEQSKLKFQDDRAQLCDLESSVPTPSYVPTLLKQLESLGKSLNLKVIGVRPEPPSETPAPRKLNSGAQAAAGNLQAASATGTPSAAQNQPGSSEKPYGELNITIQLRGSYMNALDFLYKLTTFPKIVAVNSVEISPISSSSNKPSTARPTLDVKLNVTAFILKSQAVCAGASAQGGSGNEAG